MRRPLLGCSILAASALVAHAAAAVPPNGAQLVRLMGARAQRAFAPPGAQAMGALVRLPAGMRAADVGLPQAAPGFARLWGSPSTIVSFADAHPDLPVEVAPPLHLLLDTATTYVTSSLANTSGQDGTGTLVGIADTGLDVTHPDFLDGTGASRVAWLLDLSAPPRGEYSDLEQQFGITDGSGNVVAGAVWAAADITAQLKAGATSGLPQDEVGHGTLVSACAAGDGLQGRSVYRGVAPKAGILAARITPTGTDAIDDTYLLQGVAFLFDRATAMGLPVVVNLSIGTDFGPHDGTMAWEETLASYVGPTQPGRALVVAAGNSGDQPVHQNVHVNPSTEMRVPLTTSASQDGGVEIWVAMHPGANLRVGLDSPDGTWISPVGANDSAGKNTSAFNAAVYNGSGAGGSPVPSGSDGAVVVWQGAWPGGTYYVTLEGSGTADLYVEGTGDQADAVGWTNGVREGTINLPATNPSIIGVGCTINKSLWTSVQGYTLGLAVPQLDALGMDVPNGSSRDPVPGEPCWFSSAGPTVTGTQKPEIMAPGAAIVGAMSAQAVPPASLGIFTDPQCPAESGSSSDQLCQEIDPVHAVSFGTSFASPLVAGAAAILFQQEPTLTQDQILAALQGGAHPLRGAAVSKAQSGVGELDVVGAVTALQRTQTAVLALPDASESWVTLGADTFLADGSTPMQAIVELRAARTGKAAAPPADGFDASRLAAYGLVDGLPYTGAIASFVRRGPGVWMATVQLPGGLGGSTLTVGATFDGNDVAPPQTIPIATDVWNAEFAPTAKGGCVVGGTHPRDVVVWTLFAGAVVFLRTRRTRARRAA